MPFPFCLATGRNCDILDAFCFGWGMPPRSLPRPIPSPTPHRSTSPPIRRIRQRQSIGACRLRCMRNMSWGSLEELQFATATPFAWIPSPFINLRAAHEAQQVPNLVTMDRQSVPLSLPNITCPSLRPLRSCDTIGALPATGCSDSTQPCSH